MDVGRKASKYLKKAEVMNAEVARYVFRKYFICSLLEGLSGHE
jgi:hypothetical protein